MMKRLATLILATMFVFGIFLPDALSGDYPDAAPLQHVVEE